MDLGTLIRKEPTEAMADAVATIGQVRVRQQQYQIARDNIRTYQLEAIAMLCDISPTTPFADRDFLQDIRKKLDDIDANLKLLTGEL